MNNKNRLEDYHELVHVTVKNLIWIDTEISKDKHAINIKIVFANKCAIIPIKIEDIQKNCNSARGFFNLLKPLLEAVLEPYIKGEQK